jgi:hypothetical protein
LPDMVELSRRIAMTSRRPAPVSVLSAIELANDRGKTLYVRQPISVDRGYPYLQAGDVRSLHEANTLFAPTEALRAIGGWGEDFKGWETDDFLLRLSRVSSIEGVSRVTYRMHDHGGRRLTRDAWVMIQGAERTLRDHRAAFAQSPKRRAMYLARIGSLYFEVGDWRRGMAALSESLWFDPLGPGAVPRWLAGLAGPAAYRALRVAARRARSLLSRRKAQD